MKIVVVGSGGVGKSCCTLKYLKDKFFDDYDPTIEESYKKTVVVNGRKCDLEVFDTAGQDEFKMFRDMTLGFGDGYLVVYAIDDKSSWKDAKVTLKKVLSLKDEPAPAVLLGNKLDLESRREVPTAEAAEYAKQFGVTHMECSAKEALNLTESFETLITSIWDQQSTGGGGAKPCCIIT